MKKRLLSTALIAILGVGVMASTVACDTAETGYEVSITNKDEISSEWHLEEANRQLEIEISYEGEIQNASSAISTGELVVTSSDTSVVSTGGLYVYAIAEGEATVTASYHGHEDSVDITILPETVVELPTPADWVVGKEYALGFEKNGEIYYYDGGVLSTYYGSVSTTLSAAEPVLIESYGSGYSLKLQNGCYLGYEKSDTHHNFKWDLTSPFEWIYDEDLNAFGAYDGDTLYVMGASGSYNEIAMISISGTYYVAHLYELGEKTNPTYVKVKAPTTTLYVGESVTLTTEVDEGAYSDVTMEITSTSEEDVITLVDNVVTAVKAGTATITVVSTYDASISTTISFTVSTATYTQTETITSANLGFENAETVSEVYGSLIKVSFDANEGSTPAYYTTSSAIRVYRYNSVTFSARCESLASIASIVITYAEPYTSGEETTNYNGCSGKTVTNGTLSDDSTNHTLTISSSSTGDVVLTNTPNEVIDNSETSLENVQLRIVSMTITYTDVTNSGSTY